MSKLYIIGNGFDAAHRIPSSYSKFNEYVRCNYPKVYERIGRLYGGRYTKKLWTNFENRLGFSSLRIKQSIIRNRDEWARESKLDPLTAYQERSKMIDTFWGDVLNLFQTWIEEDIAIKTPCPLDIHLSKDDYYLVFNYTHTLESLYNIPPVDQDGRKHICYIHNQANSNEPLRPIVGHGLSSEQIKQRIKDSLGFTKRFLRKNKIPMDPEEVLEGYKYILEATKKDTDAIIEWNRDFFDIVNKTGFTDIYVLGHSIGVADKPYFKLIHQLTSNPSWHVSYHYPSEKKRLKERLVNIIGSKYSIEMNSIKTLLQ